MARMAGCVLVLAFLVALPTALRAQAECTGVLVTSDDCNDPDFVNTPCGLATLELAVPSVPGGPVSGYCGSYCYEYAYWGVDVDECPDPEWRQSICGRAAWWYTLGPGAVGGDVVPVCVSLCAETAPQTAAQCRNPDWLSSLCGEYELIVWAHDLDRISQAYETGACSVPTLAELEADGFEFVSTCAPLVGWESGAGLPTEGREIVTEVVDCAAEYDATSVCPATSCTLTDGNTCVSVFADFACTGQLDTGRRVDATVAPYDRSGHSHEGMASHYYGLRLREWAAESSGAARQRALPPFYIPVDPRQLAREAWDANGIRVDSCEEYVYEKYYDYSLFEDAAAALGEDYRAVFDIAYAGAPDIQFLLPDVLHMQTKAGGAAVRPSRQTSAIATSPAVTPALVLGSPAIAARALRGVTAKSKDGRPLLPQPALTGEIIPRNAFFQLPSVPDSIGIDPPWIFLFPGNVAGNLMEELQTSYGRCSLRIGTPVICDETLRAAVQNAYEQAAVAAPRYDTFWWHKYQSDRLANGGFLDEELYAFGQKRERFEHLLGRRAQLVERLMELSSGEMEVPVDTQRQVFDPEIVMGVRANPVAQTLAQQHAMRDAAVATVMMNMGNVGSSTATGAMDQTARTAMESWFNAAIGMRKAARTTSPTRVSLGSAAGTYATATQTASPPTSRERARPGFDLGDIRRMVVASDTLDPVAEASDLVRALAVLDGKIENALAAAYEAGCLEVSGLNPCDWNPKDFAQRVLDIYTAQREFDYQRCLSETSSEWPVQVDLSLPDPNADCTKAMSCPVVQTLPNDDAGTDWRACFVPIGDLRPAAVAEWGAYPGVDDRMPRACVWHDDTPDYFDPGHNDWTASTTALDYFYLCQTLRKQLLLDIVEEAVGDVVDEDGNARVRRHEGDGWREGNDDFNIQAGYGFGWELMGFDDYRCGAPQGSCVMKPEAYGFFYVVAKALFIRVPLIDAYAHARMFRDFPAIVPDEWDGRPLERLHLEVAGMVLADEGINLSAPEFNLIEDESRISQEIVSGSASFVIVVVPVTLRVGLSGYVGVSYAVGAWVDSGADDGQCGVKLKANLTPFAGVDVYASASLNAGVAEVGIKVTLTIVRVDLPFQSTVGFTPTGKLLIDTTLDLVISMLSGRFSLFARILWETYEMTLFAWDGLRFVVNIFGIQIEFSFELLADAINSLPTGASPCPDM